MKNINDDYIAKAKKLSEEDRDRVLSRMGGKLPKRLQKEKLTIEEAIAIQLELEDEQLQEWRANLAGIQEKAAKVKSKAEEKIAKAKANEEPAKAAKPAVAKEAPAKKVSPVARSTATAKAPAKPVATAKPTVNK
jgi:hypothetical protein